MVDEVLKNILDIPICIFIGGVQNSPNVMELGHDHGFGHCDPPFESKIVTFTFIY